MKEQHTVLALSCAKRESTAEALGRANTPSVIMTAPKNIHIKQRKQEMLQTCCLSYILQNVVDNCGENYTPCPSDM